MQKKSLSRYWLIIGVTALAVAGLFSLVLAGGRSPKLGSSAFLQGVFHKSLVVHVDLSVLVWFLAMACLMWSVLTENAPRRLPYVEEASQWGYVLGLLAITFSPLDPRGEAFMSNYIPVIYSPLFFLGLMLIGCGTVMMALRAHMSLRGGDADEAIQPVLNRFPSAFALQSAALITLISIAAFVWSWRLMPSIIDGQQYYDMLFWAGGHVLQFTHTQVMMVAWVVLIYALSPQAILNKKLLYALFSIGLLCALATPIPFLRYDITSAEFRQFFTHLMIAGNGIAPVILALMILPVLWRARGKNALWTSLAMSLLLFIYGGLLGGMIQGQNVVIPAHYHGSIVGVTLAFMGLAYMLLPAFGYKDVTRTRLAYWQPIVYALGQLMHVTGFAWSGGYGVLRKTPGGTYDGAAQLALGLMGGGAGLAAIGGLMFVVAVGKAIFTSPACGRGKK